MKDTIIGGATKNPVMKYVIYAVYAVVILFILILLYRIFSAAKAGLGAAGDLASDATIAATSGTDIATVELCRSVAEAVQAAHKKELWGLYYYNDTKAITAALNRLSTAAESRLTCNLYQQLTGSSLKADITDALFNGWQGDINREVFNALY